MCSLLDLVRVREKKYSLFIDDLVQNLFPSNFFGNCDLEEERKLAILLSRFVSFVLV